MDDLKPVRIAIHPALRSSAAEVKYVFRTLLRVAGLAYEFVWAEGDSSATGAQVYYGPAGNSSPSAVNIVASGIPLRDAAQIEPRALREQGGLYFLDFANATGEADSAAALLRTRADGALEILNDIVLTCYWLLTGARERHYRRDSWDNLDLDGSFFVADQLASKPVVSLYGAFLREHFRRKGHAPLEPPWAAGRAEAAFSFTHDVDYPQMIRSIECLRLIARRGLGAFGSVAGVLRGTNHFWKFAEWVEFERALGTRPAFYFMARQGSLLQFATGTPDAFYDVRAPEFQKLFRELREAGCEIGLHASYRAYRSADTIRREREALEAASGVAVLGNRHHFWHLDPEAPEETLLRGEQAGVAYDSSLAFEFYPGYRRGICHPFRPYHPGQRRELGIVELPPTWMDDHFDRRLKQNGITDPVSFARNLIGTAQRTGGTVVVDYHVRGMNRDFYPRYGPWLTEFVRNHISSGFAFCTPGDLVQQYLQYEKTLEARSADLAGRREAVEVNEPGAERLEIHRMRPNEVAEVARMHFEFFGQGEMHGRTVANLGPEFLAEVFYGLNVDNPYLFVDVALYGGEIIAFNVYASDGRKVFRETLRRHWASVAGAMLKLSVRRPLTVTSHVIGNLRFFTDAVPEEVREIRAWSFLFGVKPEFRTREFREQTGIWVAGELWETMERTLREAGCDRYWGVVAEHNGPMNHFWRRHCPEPVARGPVQGFPSNYYTKSLRVDRSATN